MRIPVEATLATEDRILLADIAESLRQIAQRPGDDEVRRAARRIISEVQTGKPAGEDRLTVSTEEEIIRLTLEEQAREQSGLSVEEWRRLHGNG